MRMPSRPWRSFSMLARRARVSRLPSPASMRRRVLAVSSTVMFPELPDARMETRKPIVAPRAAAEQIFSIMAERRADVNGDSREKRQKTHRRTQQKHSVTEQRSAGHAGEVEGEPIEGTENGHRDLLGAEKLLS